MSISWWRSWHGAPIDHKWSVIANRAGSKTGIVSAVAWALFDYASQNKERGSIAGFDTETYAVYSGFPQDEIEAIMQAMTDKGIIQDGRLKNWEKRQPKREDDSNERVRKFRAMKRSVTQSNADDGKETPQIQIKDKESEEGEDAEPANIFETFEQEIGPLTPTIAEELKEAENVHTGQWVCEALRIASINNKRNWGYAKAILKRWQVEGYGSQMSGSNKNGGRNVDEPAGFQGIRDYMESLNGNQ